MLRALSLACLLVAVLSGGVLAYDTPPKKHDTRPHDAKLANGATLKIPKAGLAFLAKQLEGGLQGSSLRNTISEALEGQYFEIVLPIFGGILKLTIPCGSTNPFKPDPYFDVNYGYERAWCPYVRGTSVRQDQTALPTRPEDDRGFRYQRVALDVATYPIANLAPPQTDSLFAALYLVEADGKRAQLDMVPEHPLFKMTVPVINPNDLSISYACYNLLGNGADCASTFVATLEADLVTGGELRPYFNENILYVLVHNFDTRLVDLEILTDFTDPENQNNALLAALDACVAVDVGGISDGCREQRAQVEILYDSLNKALGDAAMQFFERELNAALSGVLEDGINQLMFDESKDGTPDPVIDLTQLARGMADVTGYPFDFNFDARYQASATDPAEAYLILDGGLYAGAFSSCVNAASQPGFRYTHLENDGNVGHDPPRLGNVMPSTTLPYQLAMALSDDFVNQMVYGVWATGVLCATVSPDSPDLPEDVADLLVTESFAPFVPWLPKLAPKAPVSVRVVVREPPYVTLGDTGDGSILRLHMPALVVDVLVSLGGADKRPVRAFGLNAAVTAAVEIHALNFDTAPLIDLSVTFESSSEVAFNDLRPEDSDRLNNLLEPILAALAPGVAEFIGDMEIPLVTDCLAGLRQRDLVLATSGRDQSTGYDNYAEIYLNFDGLLDFNNLITNCLTALGAPRVPDTMPLGIRSEPGSRLAPHELGLNGALPYRVRFDGGFWSRPRTGTAVLPALLDGAHSLEIRQEGRAVRAEFVLDTAPPVIRVIRDGDGVTIEANDVTPTALRVNGGAWLDSPSRRMRLAPGRHTLRIDARDAAGHEASITEVVTVREPGGCSSAGNGLLLTILAALSLPALRRGRPD